MSLCSSRGGVGGDTCTGCDIIAYRGKALHQLKAKVCCVKSNSPRLTRSTTLFKSSRRTGHWRGLRLLAITLAYRKANFWEIYLTITVSIFQSVMCQSHALHTDLGRYTQRCRGEEILGKKAAGN